MGYGIVTKGYRLFDPVKNEILLSRDVIFFEDTFTKEKSYSDVVNAENKGEFVTLYALQFEEVAERDDERNENARDRLIERELNPEDQGENDSSGGSELYESVTESRESEGFSEEQGNSDAESVNEDLNPEEVAVLVSKVAGPQRLEVGNVYRDPRIDVENIVEGTRKRQKPEKFDAGANNVALVVAAALGEPRKIEEAWSCAEAPHWREASDSEYNSLLQKGTWEIVPLPKARKVVGCKWIFKVKRKADGSIDKYKARLVCQRFSQEYGIDYDEVFAPVARDEAMLSGLCWH